jgi:hypothetical protein
MFGKPYCSYQKVFLTFSEHDCLPPVQSLLSNDLFAALKEVIAANPEQPGSRNSPRQLG